MLSYISKKHVRDVQQTLLGEITNYKIIIHHLLNVSVRLDKNNWDNPDNLCLSDLRLSNVSVLTLLMWLNVSLIELLLSALIVFALQYDTKQ